MMKENPIGLYVHVPFCDGKCPYCDFYSLRGTEESMDNYTKSIIDYIKYYSALISRPADTLYFGGGTPSLLGTRRLAAILDAARHGFTLADAEITCEVNPTRNLDAFFPELYAAGFNRLSIGLQSANEGELRLLGRRHTAEQAWSAVKSAQRAGFTNISLDLMLAVQGQTQESLRDSIAFCADAGVQHVSSYLLKVEPGTQYGKRERELDLPGEEEAAELYLLACGELERCGFGQYEISNFARPGFKSRHNLKYWNCEEYLGLGPAAHSYLQGKRFYYPRSLRAFLEGEQPAEEGPGGAYEEYAMLRLRLTEGLTNKGSRERFGVPVPEDLCRRARPYQAAGLVACDRVGVRLTRQGFLVSNALLAEIL